MKFVFVTGGVASSTGKGLVAASLGTLLAARGLTVTFQKLDVYLNIDAGTMNPVEHGEVFVTADGAECDLDIGVYERFTPAVLSRANDLTGGAVYAAVLRKERAGDYDGATVQVVPHVTDEIKERMTACAADADVAIIECGGTVGDLEPVPFLEAIRQLRQELPPGGCAAVHVAAVPFFSGPQEVKTKPAQHSVQALRQAGIHPDLLVARCDRPLAARTRGKLAAFCGLPADSVLVSPDVNSIYELPLVLHQQGFDEQIRRLLALTTGPAELTSWQAVVDVLRTAPAGPVIAVVGKYVELADSYKSLNEALVHGGIACERRVVLRHIDAEEIERSGAHRLLSGVDGVLVAGGFGTRGIEGKIAAAHWARTTGTPYLGICLGLQVAVIDYARDVLELTDAHSTEFAPATPDPVIDLRPDQRAVRDRGGTMRLGSHLCALTPGSGAANAYGRDQVEERHRHRYEVNNAYREALARHGMVVSGQSPDGSFVEIVELPEHPYFTACQFHPEYLSRPTAPHPLYRAFVAAALARVPSTNGVLQ
ncbi:CTP synthase [Amycolatopsis sp. lyj-23]|uniref:CTP synthase n=1 Tax=Amycolatopsis sp. lyj-23 TaxID=2789283 RepID=UPI00397B62CB